jgi:hypothetical protein
MSIAIQRGIATTLRVRKQQCVVAGLCGSLGLLASSRALGGQGRSLYLQAALLASLAVSLKRLGVLFDLKGRENVQKGAGG